MNDSTHSFENQNKECINCNNNNIEHDTDTSEPIFKRIKDEFIKKTPENMERDNSTINQKLQCPICLRDFTNCKDESTYRKLQNNKSSSNNYGTITPVVVINIIRDKEEINIKALCNNGITNPAFDDEENIKTTDINYNTVENDAIVLTLPENYANSSPLKSSGSIGSTGSSKVKTLSIIRRSSNDVNGMRRESLKNMIFGDLKSGRRFSKDIVQSNTKKEISEDSETIKVIFLQVFIPFLIAGFGNVGAGLILDYVQHWDVFEAVAELFILVASFLGFKGNLEMTLAARLSTQANLGNLDNASEQWKMGVGNVLLIQCQAIVVAFLAALIAILVNVIKEWRFEYHNCFLICATSLVTASVTGLFLASLMIVVIIISRKAGVNPDNCSTLIAAFLGDITAVILLSISAKLLYMVRDIIWIAPVVIVAFLAVLPLFLIMAKRNEYTRDIVNKGWYPIIIAMVISSIGGFIFDFAVGIFETIAIFQPIINGVGSNLVAVQSSRISTYLHQRCSLGELPPSNCGVTAKICQSPHRAFVGSNPNVRAARLLLLMAIPGHIIYIITIRLIKFDEVKLTVPFIGFYLLVAVIQVSILLYIAHILVPFLWTKSIDPDNSAIPGIMATGDLIGTALLTAAYLILVNFGDPNVRKSVHHFHAP